MEIYKGVKKIKTMQWQKGWIQENKNVIYKCSVQELQHMDMERSKFMLLSSQEPKHSLDNISSLFSLVDEALYSCMGWCNDKDSVRSFTPSSCFWNRANWSSSNLRFGVDIIWWSSTALIWQENKKKVTVDEKIIEWIAFCEIKETFLN